MKITMQEHEDIIWALEHVSRKVLSRDSAARFVRLREKLIAECDPAVVHFGLGGEIPVVPRLS